MIPELAPPRRLGDAEQTSAITAIIHTGARLHAPTTDVRLVLDVLFQEPQS